mgnify:FL=1
MLTFLPMEEVDLIGASMSKPDYVPNTAQVCWHLFFLALRLTD